MSEFKPYEPPQLTISPDEYLHLLGEHRDVLENHRKLMREHTELIEKYHELNDNYVKYKTFVKPQGVYMPDHFKDEDEQ